MEQETLFTASKWNILKCLESGKKSPNDLARESNTSVANISQQLRLLELVGFVKSERISNRDKGMPRILYSLAGNYSYLVISSPGFVDKKFSKLEDYQKMILKIWFLDDKSLQYYIEKFFWSIEKHLSKVEYLAFDISDSKQIKVFIITENQEVKKSIKDVAIEGDHGMKNFIVSFVKEPDVKKNSTKYIILHNLKK